MSRFFYTLILTLLMPLVWLYLYGLRGRKNPGYREHFTERFGFTKARGDIILHCASVGEVLATAPLIKALLNDESHYTLVISTNTPTGREQINQLFANEIATQRVHVTYLPFDLPLSQRRFVRRSQAKLLAIIETELWPNLLHSAKTAGLSTLVINARLSEKSAQGYARVAPLTHAILNDIDLLACHHQDDGERFVALGLAPEKLTITGSIKFDISVSEMQREQALNERQCLGERPIWIAGSTHPGEPEILIAAHNKVRESFPDAVLIVAPRHPEQFDKVAQLLGELGVTFSRRSQDAYQGEAVLLADTLGELTMLYGTADVAFIGGSLITRGGHNPLEACAHGIAVLSGKHTFNFDHVYPALIEQGGARFVDEQTLATELLDLLQDTQTRTQMGQQGLEVVKQNQGAIARTVTLIKGTLNSGVAS
ncbi:lipid IV(A) 3-deoxy-D-manno-octulosonic acid transferase [Pseudoalteromonas sp. YIC-656]|uniref:lipid IV(A) 3-deoxy-D-manno-octulosonic acid transferase n=1 Tax=Pseudoalteromonas pernae TaxID=3118054 RepID=UPI00324241D2